MSKKYFLFLPLVCLPFIRSCNGLNLNYLNDGNDIIEKQATENNVEKHDQLSTTLLSTSETTKALIDGFIDEEKKHILRVYP